MPVCSINPASEEYADFIVRHSGLTPEELYETYQVPCLDYVNQEFVILYVPLQDILPVTLAKYTYNAIPTLYTLLDTTSMEASGILQTFNQPALNLKGEGIIVGLIDTGIEYQNPLFRNSDGTTRILGIWDQTIPGPEAQEDEERGIPDESSADSFSYGREFTQEQINAALAAENPLELVPTTDTNGHGTFLAGIAAGGMTPDESFTGAAPACQLGIVKLKPAKQYLREFYEIQDGAIAYQENDIMMGIKYLLRLANRLRMPLVILLGVGTNQGSHTGTSPLGLQIQNSSRYVGVVTVVAGGNETGLRHHYLGQMVQNQEYEDVEIRVAPGESGFILELWGMEPELYSVGFVSPTGETIQRIPILLGREARISFTLEPTVITTNYLLTESGSGSQLIFMRFQAPTAGVWRVRVYNTLFTTGRYHMWLPIQSFILDDTVFLKPNPDTTITEPGNSPFPITVSAYNHTNNSIYIHSSRGYSRDGTVKPDLAAPGVEVFGPGLQPSGRSALLADDSGTFPMTRKTGTSVAAAHVAGAVADLLNWGLIRGNDLTMNYATVKSRLIRGARRNPAYTYPNREWGYGTLDLYSSFTNLRE